MATATEQYNQELYHYGVKGMKWGVRRANKYEAKAEQYRSLAKKTSNPIKSSKYNAKAEDAKVKALLARDGKNDLKKLRAAGKLHGGYIDTQGFRRGPYADAVGSIRAEKGERYASKLMEKDRRQSVMKMSAAIVAGSAAYAAGMAYILGR